MSLRHDLPTPKATTVTIAVANNGKKMCFSSTDTAGNIGYTATAALTTAVALTATIGSVPTGSAKSQKTSPSVPLRAGATVKHNLITSGTCNATNYGSVVAPRSPSQVQRRYRDRHQ